MALWVTHGLATRCCVSRVVGQPPLCPADPAPQSEPLDERQVANSVGGHSYPVDDMTRLQRFLILGSEGGSYYADERKLTLENAPESAHQDVPLSPGLSCSPWRWLRPAAPTGFARLPSIS